MLQETLENSARLYDQKTALVFNHGSFSYKELEKAANSLSHALVKHGLKRQDRVIIYLPNTVETVVSLYATLKANGVFVIINPQVKAAKLGYIINDCQARAIITDKQGIVALSSIIPDCRSLSTVISTDNDIPGNLFPDSNKILLYSTLENNHPPDPPVKTCIDIDLASLVYTSGSTGDPKGVMLTHLNMLTAARSIIQYLDNNDQDIIIDVLPLSFDYGLYQILMSVMFGGTVILEKSFLYPSQILDTIKKYRVTGFPLVPTIASLLLTLRNLKGSDFPYLRYMTNTGQVLPPSHISRLRNIFPDVKIFSMYGLTECKRVSYLPPDEIDRKPASVGRAIPNTEVYIVDEKGQEIKEPFTTGQLVVRGSHVMRGYWGLPEKTADSLRPGKYPGERVLYTGDLFQMDEEGFLYFLGRRDDMFKSGGQFVSPREVENTLHSCDGVSEAAVIGIDDEILGQAVAAFIVNAQEKNISAEDIKKYCSEHLEKHLVPKYVYFCESLPRSSNGKVQKTALKEMIKGSAL